MKLSVIVTVYQAEATLIRCIKSVERALEKMHTRYLIDGEIIIVNDGSTDDSLLICKSLAKKYKNIIVMSQETRGKSSSRNEALYIATGDYICFVEPEDEVDDRYFINLYSHMKSDTSLVTSIPYEESITAIKKKKPLVSQGTFTTIETTWDAIDKYVVEYNYNTVLGMMFRRTFILHSFQPDKEPLSESCFLVDYLCEAKGIVKILSEQQYIRHTEETENITYDTLSGIKRAYLYISEKMNERGCKRKEALLLKYLDNYMKSFHKLSAEEQNSPIGREMFEEFAAEGKNMTKDMHISLLESIYYFGMLRNLSLASGNAK